MGAFTKIFQRLKLTSDSNVATQTTAVIQADTTNSSIAIVPNGTGAIIASVPDGTATGGNTRGAYAVDLQMLRNNQQNVAAGNYSFIGSGYNNRANGSNSVSNGGEANTASSNYSTISGGQSNTASTNTHATVVGGNANTSSGQFSMSGGANNVSSGSNGSLSFGRYNTSSGYATVAMGYGNSASNTLSGVLCGQNNNASGNYSTIIGGLNNVATGIYSSILGGNTNNAANTFSLASGSNALSYLYGGYSHSSGKFTNDGDNQITNAILRNSGDLISNGNLGLFLDSIGASFGQKLIPNGNNRAWNVQIDTIAVVTAITGTATGVSVGDTYQEKTTLNFKRIGGTSSLVALGSRQQVYDTSMSTATMNFSAGASQELQLQFQSPIFAGGGSITCRVVSKVSLVEVAY